MRTLFSNNYAQKYDQKNDQKISFEPTYPMPLFTEKILLCRTNVLYIFPLLGPHY